MDLCKKPISCRQCSKLICYHHTRRIENRCPHCRLSPYEFQEEEGLDLEIRVLRNQAKDQMKKENTFKCLVEGCSFEGKYHAMVVHKKSRHFEERIDEMIFPEERENKKKRDALKKLFFGNLIKTSK